MIAPREWDAAAAAAYVKMPTDADDKYSRGVVGVRTGSRQFAGAAVLGVCAAWRAGAGMVRYVGPDLVGSLVLQRRPETVLVGGRVQAWVIGSGTSAESREADEEQALRRLLGGVAPVVVDAGALDLASGASAPLVLTPHAGEFARLRRQVGLDESAHDDAAGAAADAADDAAVAETARVLNATVLRKGARTVVATPGGWSAAVRAGTPWLATAGTGDVLGGVLGAILAAHADEIAADREMLGPLAATAAFVHGAAGRQAAGVEAASGRGGHPLTALEVADAVPGVLGALAAGAAS
ncbi:NAD(P)H-hydrate dehydratase [Microbacterium sp. LRZ72]|uniref:ADP-dependent NAD(P)H-hydrate dehydratase n=1 Tax=Microbacterium sp. LRZ72 TaxID=2942481 RepID=UPI0029A7F2FA|nr:ADP/ATP-dependent (S)-NAD(P)H-hydrate dehydratase [Microbacterium sp. LRZ72]MDX2377084.1 NAD(P)H-hydrate dehydratase [Microbacterium sp. LRZ72]